MTTHTPTPWGVMHDGPAGDGMPWVAFREAAPGLTIGSPHNTELICRVSGYLQPVEANAAHIVRCVNNFDEAREWIRAALNMVDGDGTPPNWDGMRAFLKEIGA